jgi:hypothetical protein
MCSQVNRPVPESSPLGQASGGFALVIALGLMAFVLLILLSITTLVQVESQGAATRIDRLKAEQAALLSLNNAIGKLQQTAGLDKRVTAPAMAVDTVNGPRQLTGVWRSWEERDHKKTVFSVTPNFGSKLVNADFDIDVAYSDSGRFLGWLVSSAYDAAIVPAAAQSFEEGFPGVKDQFEWFAIDFETTLFWPPELVGDYEFRLQSDDGSVLIINRNIIVNNDSTDGKKTETGTYTLKMGSQKLRLRYFQGPVTGI